MRPIKLSVESMPPQDWIAEAEALTEQLKNAVDDKARIDLVWANRKLWRDKRILNWLTELHHRKCWYSEAKESVSSYHVDHFRPKGRATQADGTRRAGYWWLAFDWKNYRLSGQLLNVKKRDLFPVEFPGFALVTAAHTLDLEGCQLIDPLKEDAYLLSFERCDNGECLAGPCPGITANDAVRVKTTIDVLGLNRLEALNKNRADIWDQCLNRIRDYEIANDEPIMHTRLALQCIAVNEIAKLIDEKAEFSSVAIACLEKLAPQVLRNKVRDITAKLAA